MIDEITVQHEEAAAIRTLLVDKDPAHQDLACRGAGVGGQIDGANRPQALLKARRLLVPASPPPDAATRRGHARHHRRTMCAVG